MRIVGHEEAYRGMSEEYIAVHETVRYPEGFKEKLTGNTIQEQMKLFAVAENVRLTRSSYGQEDTGRCFESAKPLDECRECVALIVEDGIIEGIMLSGAWGIIPVMPYETVTTYFDGDNNGAGSKDREDTATLICLHGDTEK